MPSANQQQKDQLSLIKSFWTALVESPAYGRLAINQIQLINKLSKENQFNEVEFSNLNTTYELYKKVLTENNSQESAPTMSQVDLSSPPVSTCKTNVQESNHNNNVKTPPVPTSNDVIQKNKSHFQKATSDTRRLLTAEPLRQLFANTLSAHVLTSNLENISYFYKNNKLLVSPVSAQENENMVLLNDVLENIKKLTEKPTEIIIPIVEQKSGLMSYISEARHIKTLHIKNIEYKGEAITSWQADYYDSKPEANNYTFPSDTVNDIVTQALGVKAKSGWRNINPQTDEPHQPLFNRSDCGFWAYNWCCALFNRTTTEDKLDLNKHFINEDEMKLLHIHREIKEEENLGIDMANEFIASAKNLCESLVNDYSELHLKKSATINILYEILMLSRVDDKEYSYVEVDDDASSEACSEIDARSYIEYDPKKYNKQNTLIQNTIKLYNNTATTKDIEQYLQDANQYKEISGWQILAGSMILLTGLTILGLIIFTDILATGASTTAISAPFIGEVTNEFLSIIGWYCFGGATTLTGMYNVYKGLSNHNALLDSCETLVDLTVSYKYSTGI